MRDLEISNSSNLNGHMEFNHLRISNINDFFESYSNKYNYYKPPFKILSDLESEILYLNNPPDSILISYKPDGDIIFLLKGIIEVDNKRTVIYEYNTSVS